MTTNNLIARGMIMPKTREYSVRDLNTIIASGAKVGGTAFEPDDCIDRALWGKPILIIDNVEYTPGVYHKTTTTRTCDCGGSLDLNDDLLWECDTCGIIED
jgi:hypothetical protein